MNYGTMLPAPQELACEGVYLEGRSKKHCCKAHFRLARLKYFRMRRADVTDEWIENWLQQP